MENGVLTCDICDKRDETVHNLIDPIYGKVQAAICEECNEAAYQRHIESFYG